MANFGKSEALLIGVAVALVAGGVGLANYMDGEQETASTVDFDGEFEQHGLSEYEAPFANLNSFTVTTGTPDSNDEINSGSYEYATAAATTLVTERTAVTHFETDGTMENVDMELVQPDSSGVSTDNVSLDDVSFYDYEAAVDANDLERGEKSVNAELDGLDAEFETGQLSEGEYAIAAKFRFDSYETPASGATDVLTEWTADADTDSDADIIDAIPIQVTSN